MQGYFACYSEMTDQERILGEKKEQIKKRYKFQKIILQRKGWIKLANSRSQR